MTQGAQIGLVFATLGFVYCFVLGVPAVAIARRRGMITAEDEVVARCRRRPTRPRPRPTPRPGPPKSRCRCSS